jgi:hypothetical protein
MLVPRFMKIWLKCVCVCVCRERERESITSLQTKSLNIKQYRS